MTEERVEIELSLREVYLLVCMAISIDPQSIRTAEGKSLLYKILAARHAKPDARKTMIKVME